MKKYILGTLILALVAAGIVFTQFYTNNAINKMTAKADEAVQAVKNEDFITAKDIAEEIKENFEKYNTVMSTYISHIKLDEISASISKLQAYIDNESNNDSLSELYNIKARLDIIRQEEKICFENIL